MKANRRYNFALIVQSKCRHATYAPSFLTAAVAYFHRWAAHAMRLITVILLTCSDIALGNPRVASAYRNAYLASERLVIEVRPTEARFTGEFHFRFTEPADRYNRTNSIAVCGVEVWLPPGR